ncbi:unnamed protein product, partial [Urochloa humidicola]
STSCPLPFLFLAPPASAASAWQQQPNRRRRPLHLSSPPASSPHHHHLSRARSERGTAVAWAGADGGDLSGRDGGGLSLILLPIRHLRYVSGGTSISGRRGAEERSGAR